MQYIRRIIIQIGKEILGFRNLKEKLQNWFWRYLTTYFFDQFVYLFLRHSNAIKPKKGPWSLPKTSSIDFDNWQFFFDPRSSACYC